MPLFDYKCNDCDLIIEELVKRHDDKVFCEKCGKPMIKLLCAGKYRFEAGHFFEPYVDTDIHPDGKPLKIHSQEEFFSQCRKYGRGWRKISDRMR